MSDWLLRPISSLKPGDSVVGLETGCLASRSRLVPATVLTVTQAPVQIIDLHLASGNAVRCSSDALWYTNRFPGAGDPLRRIYANAKLGASLMQIDLVEEPPTARAHLMWHWLAGMVDGEGHVADSSLPITQTTTKNGPVWDKLCEVLNELGIGYNVRYHSRGGGNGNWQPRADAVIRNVRDVYKRLIRYTDPGKRRQMVEALWRRPRRPIRARDRVTAVGHPQREAGWQITTTSGNQVIWGYLASNSALSKLCPAGHVLDVREDKLGKVYQTCCACGSSPVTGRANEVRRQKAAIRRAMSPDDVALLARANNAVASGQARALRRSVGLTQRQLAGLCDVSQPRLSFWESGSLITPSPAGVRYARTLERLSARG
jgi:DNA-binding transcriptional regulator YiaG